MSSETSKTATELNRIIVYAKSCIDDIIPSCRKHKDACKRLLNDVERMKNEPDYPYYWDEENAEMIVKWFSLLRHSKGELSGRPIELTDWQRFNLCQLYGWKRKIDNRRRFRKMFLEVGRKNAKSQMLAGIALYESSVTSTKNNEAGEVYTAGTKRDQSQIVFNECNLMLRGSPLRKKFGITRSGINHTKTNSFIKALSKDDGKNGDGTNPACLILDEFHQHKTREFYDLFIGANTKEPLLVIITTAGVDLTCPCKSEYDFCSDVINPDIDIYDEEYLIDICEQDEEDYADPRTLKNEKLWIKSNPIRATFPEGIEKIRTTFQKALKLPEDMPACLTKNFDIWVQARDCGYMDMSKWKKCEVKKLPIDLTGLSCVVGVDLSAKIDLSAVCFVIPFKNPDKLDAEGEPITQYIIFQHSFIPNREKLIEREITDKVPYSAWEQMGLLTVTGTQIVDQKAVMLWTLDKARELGLSIESWAIDPHNATMFMTTLSDRGENAIEVPQTYSVLNDPTAGFREEVYQGNIIYTPDPLFNFAMSNAVIRKSDGRIKIDKDATTQRIDPVDACICAFRHAQMLEQILSDQKAIQDSIDSWLEADW